MTIPTTREELHDLLRAAIAKEIACEPECAAYPQGCGCADNVAMAVLSTLEGAGIALAPKEATAEMVGAGRLKMPAEIDYWQEGGVMHAAPRPVLDRVSPVAPYAAMLAASPYRAG